MAHAELEIVLRWRRLEDAFDVSLAYDDPNGPQDRRDYVDERLPVDTAKLMDLVAEDEEYGKTIGGMLLNVPKISTFYNKALTAASVRDIPVHVRLLVDPRAPLRYHTIRWEAIRDPDDGFRIATRHNLLLSRYLSTPDFTIRAELAGGTHPHHFQRPQTGGELRCLSRSPPRAAAHIRELLLI